VGETVRLKSSVFDVIVLGLGAMGSASIYQLAKKGRRVLGIDQFSPPHTMGSTHGGSRVTRQAIGEGEEYVPLALRSYELWREIEAATGTTLLEATGGLIMASPSAGASLHGESQFVEQTVNAAKKFGIAHSLLDAGQIRSRFPQFNLRGDEQGYYEPSMGFLRPELCVAGQIDLARRHGAEIRTNEKILELIPRSGEVIVRTESGRYTAGRVVVSAGAWINHLLGNEWSALFSISRQVLCWFDVNDGIESFVPSRFPVFIWVFGSEQDDFNYGIPAIDGPKGGVKIGTEQHLTETDPDTVDRNVTAAEIDEIYRRYVQDRLPGLSPRCIKASVCLYTTTPGSRFVIDFHPAQKNLLIVSPCSGHGFKHSAAIGEIVSDLLTSGSSRMDIRPFTLSGDSLRRV